MIGAEWGLVVAAFAASFVEFVEALTIVLAMGTTRGWRSALAGTATALIALVAFTVVAGYSLATWLPEAALQLVVGMLLLIFGLQWLRKAILRSTGHKSMHDEDAEYRFQTEAARAAGGSRVLSVDAFGFVVSFKGVFLEGIEVVVVVITFGLGADNVPLATVGAAVACLIVIGLGIAMHRPLAAIPENTLKFGVGLLLASFGTYWTVEGLGLLGDTHHSLQWPGGDWAIVVLLGLWLLLSRCLVAGLRTGWAADMPETENVR